MKKIDFHIHTFRTSKDNNFDYDINLLENYVRTLEIDAIAITNHNIFIKKQYNEIFQKLGCLVFPGIEIDLENGHILVIAPIEMIEEFDSQCSRISSKIQTETKSINIEEFTQIFNNHERYLVIPHYYKEPRLSNAVIEKLSANIVAGEVQSPKKWETCKKELGGLTPVLFSDFRDYHRDDGEHKYPSRQTYIDCDELSIPRIKLTLSEKKNVFLSIDKMENTFPLLSDGTSASIGLNVILGKRSSGKSHTLDAIYNSYGDTNIKYIKQFQLIKKSESEMFQDIINRQHAESTEDYLDKLKIIVDQMFKYDFKAERSQVEEYITTLKSYAQSTEKQDIYSKTKIFSEDLLLNKNNKDLQKLINALIYIIDNNTYRNSITKYIDLSLFPSLIHELIDTYRENVLKNIIINNVNQLVANVKGDLGRKSSVVPISEFNFIDAFKHIVFVDYFNKLIEFGGKPRILSETNIFDFKVINKISPIKQASELNNSCKTRGTQHIFDKNDTPFNYFEKLIANKDEINLIPTEIYKAFWKLNYIVKNQNGKELSGGEKAEFNLLAELKDSSKYEIVLIDEPESSFDNIFLNENVIRMIKDLSNKSTVFVVTHNNTLGILLKPDCIIYTEKNVMPEGLKFSIYTGKLTAKNLTSIDGRSKPTFEVLMGTMEASFSAYKERKEIYDSIKD